MSSPDFNVCFVGHVDHGKSTIVGRLLFDSGALPEGKFEQIRNYCEANSKIFEYAFILDALKEEQQKGITIDSARVFFQSPKRRYQIIDAPGHFEFLKNMVSGASRADAAFLVVDANEGFTENSKRHASMLHFLKIPHLAVLINKMDLVQFSEERFLELKSEVKEYLSKWNIKDVRFIPVSGYHGDQLVTRSEKLKWFDGPSLIEYLDSIDDQKANSSAPCFLVQDVYKFSQNRIVAGTLNSGELHSGQRVTVLPSKLEAVIEKCDGLSMTFKDDLQIKRGDVITSESSTEFDVITSTKAQIVWLKTTPLIEGQNIKVKSGTQKVSALLKKITYVTNSSTLQISQKDKVEKGDIAEVEISFEKPMVISKNPHLELNRFVIVDDYQISGGGRFTNATS